MLFNSFGNKFNFSGCQNTRNTFYPFIKSNDYHKYPQVWFDNRQKKHTQTRGNSIERTTVTLFEIGATTNYKTFCGICQMSVFMF